MELDELARSHPKAVFVSGHGGLATAADVKDFRDYLITLRVVIARAQAAGKTGDDLVNSVTADLKPVYGTWGFFNHFIKPNITDVIAEFEGTKKTASSKRK